MNKQLLALACVAAWSAAGAAQAESNVTIYGNFDE